MVGAMRALRFVTLGEGGSELLLTSPEGEEHYVLPVDDALREALHIDAVHRPSPSRHAALDLDDALPAAQPAPAAALPAAASAPGAVPAPTAPLAGLAPREVVPPPISPREIQVRVRAGESPDSIAAEFGMPLERVMRFAAAVIDERIRIADEARRARARRTGTDGEGKLLQFGEAVDERFRAHGIDSDTVTWDARRRDDGEWFVAAHWAGGEATHSAEWLFSRSSRTVSPLDDTASDLLSDRPIRPVLPAGPTRPTLVAAPSMAPGVFVFPPMPDADTGPLPQVDDVFDQEAPPEGPRDIPSRVPAAPAAAATATATAAPDYDAPPLPLGIAEPEKRSATGHPSALTGVRRNLGVTRRDETDEERAARARVPSWDDILLGIKRRD
ncbi:MAG: hypothetical protein QOH89_808 [Pseudonocardiales bacterium]|nr:hypothetical protein [Pseudonocardiales bacterium]